MRTRTLVQRRAALAVVAALLAVAPVVAANLSAAASPDAAAARQDAPATGLESFTDCNALLAHLKEVAAAHVSAYGFGSPSIGVFNSVGGTLAYTDGGVAGSSPVPTTVPVSAAPNPFSTTNNQEAAVDEADTVKTDGSRLVLVRGGALTTIDVRNPAKPVRRSRISLLDNETNGDGTLLLTGNRVLVMLPRWVPFAANGTTSYGPYATGEQATDLVMVSIADPSRPRVLDRVVVNGNVVAARLVGGAARVVVDSVPLDLAFVTPQSARGAAAALATNRQIIQSSTIGDWLPTIQRGRTTSPAVECPDVRTPKDFAGVGMTTIETIAMTDRIQPASASLQADSDLAYASPTHLYVTAAAWVDPATYNDPRVWERLSTAFRTDVHEFDISGPKASYVASGQVRGHPLNQYSLSDLNGQLRFATTDGPTWERPQGTRSPVSESFMTVLSPNGGTLTQVGQVGGIGRGEQIQAVRYDGTTAYVVTFRQIDPFFVLDLSQPSHPAVVGQLKVAGYSAYLHPLGGGRVLGVGADVDSHARITGARVALFDVSDPRHPKQLSSWSLPGAQTQVDFDAKAFLYWAPTHLAVVPTQNWSQYSITGAVGLRIGGSAITQVGFVSHNQNPKGITPCRSLSHDEIQHGTPNLVGYVVIDCAPNQAVTVSGFTCTAYTEASINEQNNAHFHVAAGHLLGVCTLNGPVQINRSIVVGSRLLTLSDHLLLSSDLATLAPGPFLAF